MAWSRAALRRVTTPSGIRHASTGLKSAPKGTPAKVIFSGIQPTGVPHLGNYLGALRQWKQMQDEAVEADTRILYSIVDIHALTVPRWKNGKGAPILRQEKRKTLAALLAVGLDPKKCTLFYQSTVAQHSELYCLLSNTASMGYLNRMTQWKSKMTLSDKASFLDDEASANLTHGLYSYPVLQAADILVHRATHVPVGEDQKQHLEFARQCARSFNHVHGPVFTAPKTILAHTRRVMSLQKPTSKMSKSDPDEGGRILLTDEQAVMRKKIMAALTDSENRVAYDPEKRSGVANLLEIWSHMDSEGRSPEMLAEEARHWNLLQLKTRVADIVVAEIGDVRERYRQILSEKDRLDEVLAEGTRKARQSAEETMSIVREATGLGN